MMNELLWQILHDAPTAPMAMAMIAAVFGPEISLASLSIRYHDMRRRRELRAVINGHVVQTTCTRDYQPRVRFAKDDTHTLVWRPEIATA